MMGDEGVDLPEFRNFLEAYTGAVAAHQELGRFVQGKTATLKSELVAQTMNEFDASLRDAREVESPVGYVQPLFVCALRALLKRWDSVASAS